MNQRRIEFTDLLSDGPLVVDGVALEATVSVVVSESSGTFEIDSMDMGPIHINVNGDIFLLDQSHFNARYTTLAKRFENACDLLALTKAKSAPDHKWNVESEDVA